MVKRMASLRDQWASAGFWLALASFLAITLMARMATATECLDSARAVRETHGVSAYAAWSGRVVKGKRCWYEADRSTKKPIHSSRAGATPVLAPSTKPASRPGSAAPGPNRRFDPSDGSHPIEPVKVKPVAPSLPDIIRTRELAGAPAPSTLTIADINIAIDTKSILERYPLGHPPHFLTIYWRAAKPTSTDYPVEFSSLLEARDGQRQAP